MYERDRDLEIDAIFDGDPDLHDVADLLRAVPHEAPEPDPVFRANLRRRLVEEAWKMQEQRLPWWRRLSAPPRIAWSGAVAGILLIALAAVLFTSHTGTSQMVVVASPLQNQTSVNVVKPVELSFSQPMDQQRTAQAISIQPVTAVRYTWPSATLLQIVPVQGALAPATRYDVTVGSSARTSTGQPIGREQTVTFVTGAPTPTPRPSPTPTQTPTQTGTLTLTTLQKLGPIGSGPAVWSSDGGQVYAINGSGALIDYPADGSRPTTIAGAGVTAIAWGPGGLAYAQGAQISYGSQAVTADGGNVLAIGFKGGKLVYVTSGGLGSADHSVQAQLPDQPTAAAFSPDGSRLAYVGAGGLHLYTIDGQKDQPVQGASALGTFSPDGSEYAYPTDQTVYVTTSGASAERGLSGAGMAGLSWSKDGLVLVAGSGGLSVVPAGGGTSTQLSPQALTQPQWSPAGGRILAYVKDGNVYVGKLTSGQQQQSSRQEDVVTQFMDARRRGDTATAMGLLDGSGRGDFQGLTLVYGGGQTLNRYQVLLDQTGHMVVRLVIDQGGAETAVDEDLTLRQDAQGQLRIHDASDSAPHVLGKGPEVVGVTVSASQVTITFDSDIDPRSVVAASVSVAERSASTTTYDAGHRAVVLTFSHPLDSSTTYRLQVSGGLRDIQGRPAAPFALTFAGQGTSDSGTGGDSGSNPATTPPPPNATPSPNS